MLYFACVIVHNHDKTLALFHGYLNGLLKTLVSTLDGQSVNHYFDVVSLITVDLHALFDFLYLTIDPHMQIAFLAHRLKQFTIVALTSVN